MSNPRDRSPVKKFLKPTGRLVVVGDDRQAIMGFVGANALGDLIEAQVLPLTMTWRCPKAVVARAQSLVPDIVAAEGAIEGSVTRLDALPAILEPTEAILCRNMAPLITRLRQGVVKGREIGSGLLRLVNRWKVAAFLSRLDDRDLIYVG